MSSNPINIYQGACNWVGTKKNVYVALIPTDRKMRKKQGRVFFFFFYVRLLGEEFAKICIQWLKKALANDLYMRAWLHSARVFPI